MRVTKIERIVKGAVIQTVERGPDGMFVCLPAGQNMETVPFRTLDEVANYLRENPRAGVRMDPGWCKIVLNIYIDGVPR